MDMFMCFQSLLDTVYENAESIYVSHIAEDDYNGMIIGDYAPYWMVRDLSTSDWWDDCRYFREAIDHVRVQADRTQWRMQQLSPWLVA
jgi:hypothetical protein